MIIMIIMIIMIWSSFWGVQIIWVPRWKWSEWNWRTKSHKRHMIRHYQDHRHHDHGHHNDMASSRWWFSTAVKRESWGLPLWKCRTQRASAALLYRIHRHIQTHTWIQTIIHHWCEDLIPKCCAEYTNISYQAEQSLFWNSCSQHKKPPHWKAPSISLKDHIRYSFSISCKIFACNSSFRKICQCCVVIMIKYNSHQDTCNSHLDTIQYLSQYVQ